MQEYQRPFAIFGQGSHKLSKKDSKCLIISLKTIEAIEDVDNQRNEEYSLMNLPLKS